MSNFLANNYDRLVLKMPVIMLILVALVTGFFAWHTTGFKLDASADTLILENDETLRYYRSIRARYGSDDSLIVTYTPEADLFSEAVLKDLAEMRDEFLAIPRVSSVVSLLDVPLIESPPVTLSQLSREINTLESPETHISMARQEFANSHLYRNLIISSDGTTTAIQIKFRRNETYERLLSERNELRIKRLNGELSEQDDLRLATVTAGFDRYSDSLLKEQRDDISRIRNIMDTHRGSAILYLGGVPMIVADSISFIRHDLVTFGLGVFCFLVTVLAIAFRKPRWVLLPLVTCVVTGIIMIGLLGLMNWPVTVVSSNFISLLLIITLSLTIHLIVRYRELHANQPGADQYTLVSQTLRTKIMPCFYTATTTIVAFGSLLYSGIRPVIDFGWMMAIGTAVAFVLSFTLFPATLMLLKPGEPVHLHNITAVITRFLARLVQTRRTAILAVFTGIVVLSAAGINMLTVENRFIDYFKKTTEIYQGMELIDRSLGGTTPLDVIIDAPRSFYESEENEDEGFANFLFDAIEDDINSSIGITGTSYWFNSYQLEQAAAIHDYLDSLPETGKVLSISTAMHMLTTLDRDKQIDDFFLSILYKRLPDSIKSSLFTPYMSEDGNQLRYSIRVFESDPSLKRAELLEKIQHDLVNKLDLEPSQVKLTGMLVLYNNMLQSLFRSQILTIGVVFLAIMLMFVMSFHSIRMALIAIIPNMVAALQVLGIMGWMNIPLDIMTITIAAIVIGIAVDNAIHYVHRFITEFETDRDYWATIGRCHDSIGRAMYYTTVTVTLGFTILALSNFIPTVYFGVLTAFSMLVALIANLTLLPLLIALVKPLGKPVPSN
jgi:predicted RND superfamily exporter protein